MKKLLLTISVLFLSLLYAQSYYVDMSDANKLDNPNDFFEYRIVKGDCLWFIADDFYGDPFKWPKIHKANQYIINPDWIYPNNWLVIPNVFADENGNPILGGMTKTSKEKPSYTSVADESSKQDFTEATTKEKVKSDDTKVKSDEPMVKTEKTAKADKIHKEAEEHKCDESCECKGSYCGKPGWKLGLHAGTPLGTAPEGESLNLGLLLGTPLGFRVGPLSVGLGAGVITYNFEDIYFGAGVLASLCVNDLLKLDMPLMIQLHGLGTYIFGEESGPGFGGIGSLSLPLGDTPFNLGVYGGLGKYYPGDRDLDWGNAGAVLYYNF